MQTSWKCAAGGRERQKEVLSPQRKELQLPPSESLFLLPWWGIYMNKKGRKKPKGRDMEEADLKAAEILVELGISDRHQQPPARQKLSSYLQLHVCPCECIMPGNHSECLHLFQFSIWTSPLNAFHNLSRSAFLPGGHTLTTALGKGERGEGNLVPHSALSLGLSQVEKDIISMSCSFHTLFVFPFSCLVFCLNQVQIFS